MKILILLLVSYTSAISLPDKSDACSGIWCKAGRECVVLAGKGECMCIVTCPDHLKPVCGSDGESYDSHCKLHQQACLTGTHIKIAHKGYCKKKNSMKKINHDKLRRLQLQHELANDLVRDFRRGEKQQDLEKDNDPLPAVCYSPQRDALRFLLVEHWEETLKNQSWYREGMTFRDNLWGHFFTCDSDKNNYVTPEEIIECTKHVPFFARPGQDSKITKALCVDALVDDADNNRDYRLDFEEFAKILNPDYTPKMKKCSLEGKNFVDGDEVHLDCNHCICAVGKWVCAATTCKAQPSHTSYGSHHDNTITDTQKTVQQPQKISKPHLLGSVKKAKKHLNKHKKHNYEIKKTLKEIAELKGKTEKLKKYWQQQLFEKPHGKKWNKKNHHKKNKYYK